MLSQLEIAEKIARKAHYGQTRRDGVTPYIKHVEKVVSLVNTVEEKILAWLHDVLENTDIDTHDLTEAGVSDFLIKCVQELTHYHWNKNFYFDYIENIAAKKSASKIVKIADIVANLSDTPTQYQIQKYFKALIILSVSNESINWISVKDKLPEETDLLR